MTLFHTRKIGALVLLAIPIAACSTATRASSQSTMSPAARAAGDSAAAVRARADSVRHPYTQADIDFMSHMIGHHAQAIVMARMAPTHGASPSVLTSPTGSSTPSRTRS